MNHSLNISLCAGLALATVGPACLPAHADTNLVTNPGFETGDLTGYALNAPGGHVAVGTGVGRSGNDALGIGNNPPDATLSQDLPTIAGDSYTISYYLLSPDVSGFPAGTVADHFRSTFGATTLFDENNLPALTTPVGATYSYPALFQLYTFTATAQGSTTPLQFSAFNEPSFFILDDISVTRSVAPAVPESSPFALLALGLLPLGLIAGRRRKSASAKPDAT